MTVVLRIMRLLALGLSMSACGLFMGYDDCGFEPIGASIRPPILAPTEADGVGQCGDWIDIDGSFWSESPYTFELDAGMLEPVGEADATSENVAPLAAATTYAIAGVDPAEAIAMESAAGSYLVFTKGSDTFPLELCPMLAPTGNPDVAWCDQPPRAP